LVNVKDKQGAQDMNHADVIDIEKLRVSKMCRTPKEDDFVIITDGEIVKLKNWIKKGLQLFSSVTCRFHMF
jgi:hypothetical protein